MNRKEIFKFEQNGTFTLISVVVYISVATLVGEYIISREVPEIFQMASLMGMVCYTVWQIKYIAKYFIKLFNF